MVRLVSFALPHEPAPTDAPGKHIVPRVGALLSDSVVDLTAAFAAATPPCPLHRGMRELLERGDAALALAHTVIAGGRFRVPLGGVRLLAPLYDPEKVVCVGMNYRDHCTEQNIAVPTEPLLFSKFASAIAAPGDPLPLEPTETQELDFEVELVVVVGRAGRRIELSKAAEHIAGYAVAHDVSARDWQMRRNGGQWMVGKTMDGFAPIGPAIVTRDEAGDIRAKGIRCLLNGVAVQDSNTREMVFGPEEVVAYASRFFTLKPGDLILTGTPPGVGAFRKPPLWLKDGDEVVCEIDGIGRIANRVTASPPRAAL